MSGKNRHPWPRNGLCRQNSVDNRRVQPSDGENRLVWLINGGYRQFQVSDEGGETLRIRPVLLDEIKGKVIYLSCAFDSLCYYFYLAVSDQIFFQA